MNEVEMRDPVPEFATLREIADFWDTHSTADYFDIGHEVQFEMAAKRRPRRIMLMPELREQVEAHARARGVSLETLVNIWMAERLRQAA